MKIEKINEDKRGSINILTGFKDFKEVKLLVTRKGYARGGCIHDIAEHFLVIEGLVKLFVGGIYIYFGKGNKTIIPKNIPHYIIALEDSIIMEWGANLEGTTKDQKMLDKVNRINNNL